MTQEQLHKALTTLHDAIEFSQDALMVSANHQAIKQHIADLVELREQLRHMYEDSTLMTEADPHFQQTIKGRVITSDEERHNMARAANMMRR